MSTLAHSNRDQSIVAVVPSPRCSINVRPATTADLPFIDALQKMHSHMVGFIPMKQFEKHVSDGNMLVAEETAGLRTEDSLAGLRTEDSGLSGQAAGRTQHSVLSPQHSVPPSPSPQHSAIPIGYVLAKDQYLKRDDVGIVYQLNVMPMRQRNLVGAMLIKSVFEKAAYGCRLFSCWCAQDIRANYFWESIGFVPLAFRTGSRSKQRIHIFWQRHIRENDDQYPYWFPSKTEGGAVMEDRIVLPIPLDSHWRDVKPLVLPGVEQSAMSDQRSVPLMLPGGAPVKARPEQPKLTQAQKAAIHRSQSKSLGGVPLGKKAVITSSGIRYVDRTDFVAELDTPEELLSAPRAKPKRPPAKPRQKNDPKFVTAARELRDRYLERVNSDPLALLGVSGPHPAKYDVSRVLQLPESKGAGDAKAAVPLMLDAA